MNVCLDRLASYRPYTTKYTVNDLICFSILRTLHEGHTPAAEAASTVEGQQQDPIPAATL
jgi:hypothetical protein